MGAPGSRLAPTAGAGPPVTSVARQNRDMATGGEQAERGRRPARGGRRPGRSCRYPVFVASWVLLALVGCGGPGSIRLTNVPIPAESVRSSCVDLVHDLPPSLGDDLDRRTLDPPQATAAAYGAAPVVLTCGAPGLPASYRPDAMLSVVDDVGWFAENLGGTTVRYSTPTRQPQVVLTLPADVQAFEVLVSVAPAVRAHSRSTTS
ncbi:MULTISPECIES: DUF3515 family protein [Frankia]|uniref:DUF3515 domain-containing protein n=1 Tax=Frankia casuarinae (strain DSM 45818 / CECT 9043 / HFP020203 / CcI3) TaxID=106370 RepID=Q2J6Y0_FRACC|nr:MULTISPECIES: DUF3515 family protein [Frankia]ABD12962.1 hypothetical protein Francci3_3610 [Frankia casuarinae]